MDTALERIIYYIDAFLELYMYAQKHQDPLLQSMVDDILTRQGYTLHYVRCGVFDAEFAKRYNIESPAVSLGCTIFRTPLGTVLLSDGFLKQNPPKDWIEFVIAHELAHICLNHFPITAFILEITRFLPPELRELWVKAKHTVSQLLSIRLVEEELTAQKELKADEWAVMALGRKDPAISFLSWVREQGIVISHLSPVSRLPAITIEERIKHLRALPL